MCYRDGKDLQRVCLPVLVFAVLLMSLHPAPGSAAAPQFPMGPRAVGQVACTDFESLSLGATYHVGDVFVDAGVTITGTTFISVGGLPITNGFTEVENGSLSGGAGQELQVNNINLAFQFPAHLSGLSLHFGEYGGNLNIDINGAFINFDNFADIDGLTIGGVHISVTNGLGDDMGVLVLSGTIQSFLIGGQELWIDSICPASSCVDFEDLLLGAQYHVSDVFFDSGVQLTAIDFFLSNGSPALGGYAEIGGSGLAGGTGQEIQLNNISLDFAFPVPPDRFTLRFGEYGGNLNIKINNIFINFDNFADINGLVISGVTVMVVNGMGNDKGGLILEGNLQTFWVGGQELWIDDVCPLTLSEIYLPLIYKGTPSTP